MLNKGFFKNTITVGLFTLISRVSGLVRDFFIAKYLGAGRFSDCFLIAFKIPNLFRSIFAEGAFNSAFIPIFTGILYTDKKERAKEFCKSIFALLFYILLIATLLSEIFMPYIIEVFAPGFEANPSKFNLAVILSRITFPFLFFIALTSFFGSILNTLGVFKPYALTPIILNTSMVLALLLFGSTMPSAAYAISWGVSFAGVLQLIFLWFIAKKYGFGIISFKPTYLPEIGQFFKNILPGIISAGIYHINIMIGSIFATSSNGVVSWIYYADRLNHLPLAVIGIAIATVLLPRLSREIKNNKINSSRVIFNNSLKFASLLIIPCAVGLIAISYPLIQILFERGAFKTSDTYATSQILQILCLSLPAVVYTKLFANVFYSKKDTKTPMIIASITLICNLFLIIMLTRTFNYIGIVISITISNWVGFLLLYFISYLRGFMFVYKSILKDIIKIIFLSIAMGLVLHFGVMGLVSDITVYSLFTKIFMLVLLILIGVLFYTTGAFMLRIIDITTIKQYTKR